MRNCLTVCTVLLILSACVLPPPEIVGLPYRQARELLIGSGARPARVPQDERFCSHRADICDAYPETEACAVDGRAPCRFRWTTGSGRELTLFTVGEGINALIVSAVESAP